jgi:hypothetical protein
MTSLKNDITNEKLTNPKLFNEQLIALTEKLNPIIDEFQKMYVLHKSDPNYDEYRSSFNSIKENLNSELSDLFLLNNSISSDQFDLEKFVQKLNIRIDETREQNKILGKYESNLDNSVNASVEMINDYQTLYDIQYLKNWGIFLCILISSILTLKVFKPMEIKSTT